MDGKSDYTIAIRYFARTELNYKFNFVSKYEQSSKYLLLCNVQSRIPDDLEDTIKALGLEGRTKGFIKSLLVKSELSSLNCLIFVKINIGKKVSIKIERLKL